MNTSIPLLLTLATFIYPVGIALAEPCNNLKQSNTSTLTSGAKYITTNQEESISDLLKNNEELSTLNTALTTAGLIETIDGLEGYTLFAPTNQAFEESLTPEQLEALLADKEALTEVLTYHVIPSKLSSSELKEGEVETVESTKVDVTLGDSPKVNDLDIITTDLTTANGKVHTLDGVLLPENFVLPQ
jgi:uncharacterized surface protein with fasciclin (FAS1) repeats